MDCGAACLRMIAKYYGKFYHSEYFRDLAGYTKEGISLLGISTAAENVGFRTVGAQLTYAQLLENAPLPCILHWDQQHFVVLIRTPKVSPLHRRRRLVVADPASGISLFEEQEFLKHWKSGVSEDGTSVGTVLLLEPGPSFHLEKGQPESTLKWELLFGYLRKSKLRLVQVIIALLITSLLQLIIPFLTQSIVDTGIVVQDLHYITIVLIAQLMLIFSRSIVDFMRTRILLHISNIVNLSILSDFWIKLTKLPLSYFTSHHTGDTLQRIADNKRIQDFLTGTAINTIFFLFNFIVFAAVLSLYSAQLFFVFAAGSILYFGWIYLFMRIRRKINYQTFQLSVAENNATLELVQGMQEIKLRNAERQKRWSWESIQASIFRLNFKTLTYNQFQQAGALVINQGKDQLITFFSADLVISGKLTLGGMLAIQYIIGQLSGPIEQFVLFLQSAQDSKISLERLNEVYQIKNEEEADRTYINTLPEDKTIRIQNLSFTYPGAGKTPILDDINLEIPEGKVTAIVGLSGSGKTTLLKLLLKFFDSFNGDIKVGEVNFRLISPSFWRSRCGTVMQDGFIFNDTIANNIMVGSESRDYSKLVQCCRIANILPAIEDMPNGFNTKLGTDGIGMSQGQKQRLLIARSLFKDPQYLFLDEATNALDAKNEKTIVANLREIFRGKTVIVVAHRLSTVKDADKIIVLHGGRIVEEGTHGELSAAKGAYYELVRNQLEMGA